MTFTAVAAKAPARGCRSFGVGMPFCSGLSPCRQGARMKFFLPHAESQEHAEEIYASIRSFLWAQVGARCADPKIFRLLYREQGSLVSAKVGQRHPLSGEPAIAIVYEPGQDRYHVCTPTRGVITGRSIAVEGRAVEAVVEFDEEARTQGISRPYRPQCPVSQFVWLWIGCGSVRARRCMTLQRARKINVFAVSGSPGRWRIAWSAGRCKLFLSRIERDC